MTLEHEQAASTWLLMRLFVSSDKLAHHCRGGHIRPESCFAGGGCPQFIDSFYDRPSSGTKSITMIPSQHKRDSPSVARYFHRARSGSHYRTVRPRTISAAVTAQPARLVGYDPASASRMNLSGLDRLETEMSFIDLLPMDTDPVANEFPLFSLLLSGVQKPRESDQRNRYRSTILQHDRQCIIKTGNINSDRFTAPH